MQAGLLGFSTHLSASKPDAMSSRSFASRSDNDGATTDGHRPTDAARYERVLGAFLCQLVPDYRKRLEWMIEAAKERRRNKSASAVRAFSSAGMPAITRELTTAVNVFKRPKCDSPGVQDAIIWVRAHAACADTLRAQDHIKRARGGGARAHGPPPNLSPPHTGASPTGHHRCCSPSDDDTLLAGGACA